MSFKIFTLQLSGKIKPVSTIEKQRKLLADDYADFQRIEVSEALKSFLELDETVNSGEFKSKKKEVEGLQFKGSEEENQQKEFERLKKTGRLKKYFKVADSSDLKKFEAEKEGQKLNDYYALLEYMKEGQFEKEKQEIKSQVFKGSVEEKHLKDFNRLEKSAAIRAYKELEGSTKLKKHKALEEQDKFKRYNELKNAADQDKDKKREFKTLQNDAEIKAYFKFEKSKKLRLYHEILGSHDLKQYEELKAFTSTEEFKKKEAHLKDKKKFEKSETYKKQMEYKRLAADPTVKFVLKFEKSGLYKNYLDVKDSFDLKRYQELEAILNSEDYKKRKTWLQDKKRWEKTDEYKKEQEHKSIQSTPDIVKYFKYKDSEDFEFFKKWEVVFEDDFSGKELNKERWGTALPVAEKLLGENYAMPGDVGIFTNGENINLGNKLTISVKNQKVMGKTWQMPAGFVPGEFNYTSGLITSGERFKMEDGIIEAKIRFSPVKHVASSFYLSGDDAMPRLNLVEMGVKNNVGISSQNGDGKVQNSGLDIANLKKGDYIFTLEKEGSSFNWKINNVEVWQQSDSSLNIPLQLNASSLIVDKPAGSSSFEIEWVKCYRKK